GWRGLLTAACGSLLAQGITHAGEALVAGPDVERFRQADLPLGFTLMPCSHRSSFATPWDALDGPRTGEGDTRAGVGPVKVFADGAERCAMSIPLGASMAETARVLSRAWRTRDPAGLRVLTS